MSTGDANYFEVNDEISPHLLLNIQKILIKNFIFQKYESLEHKRFAELMLGHFSSFELFLTHMHVYSCHDTRTESRFTLTTPLPCERVLGRYGQWVIVGAEQWQPVCIKEAQLKCKSSERLSLY